jgi:hypothetical protein
MSAAKESSRRESLLAGARAFVRAVEEEDEALLDSLLTLSRRRRVFAPLALMLGAFAMLLEGLKVLFSNWRLLAVQILPAVWIWLAMFDLKVHVLHGRSFHLLRGPILIPIALALIALTVASFFMNAVFAFAIAGSRPPLVGPAFLEARRQLKPITLWGVAFGALLALATTIAPRWGPPWFTVTLGVVLGGMMIVYVAVPARLIGARPASSRRDKLAASAISTALGATVCTPPYVMGRIGILMLGTRYLLVPGIALLIVGFTLQAGATGAVRAVKLSSRLLSGTAATPGAGERPVGPPAPG